MAAILADGNTAFNKTVPTGAEELRAFASGIGSISGKVPPRAGTNFRGVGPKQLAECAAAGKNDAHLCDKFILG